MEEPATNDIIKLFSENESKKRKRNLILISILVIVGLLFITVALVKVNYTEKEKDIFLQTNHNYLLIIQKEDSIKQKEDSIKQIIHLFQNKKQLSDDRLLKLFADTLERFYKITKITNKQLVQISRDFWQKNPEERFNYDSSFAIKNINSSIVTVLMTGNYCKNINDCKNEIEEIRINKNLQIFFIRAYYQNDSSFVRY